MTRFDYEDIARFHPGDSALVSLSGEQWSVLWLALGQATPLYSWDYGASDEDVLDALIGDTVAEMLAGIGKGEEGLFVNRNNQLLCVAVDWLCDDGMVVVQNSDCWLNHVCRSVTGYENDDVLSFSMYLTPGNYAINVLCQKASGRGKFRWIVNGVPLASGQDVDLYSAVPVDNYWWTTVFTTGFSGLNVFSLLNVGKHSSSGGYVFGGQLINLTT